MSTKGAAKRARLAEAGAAVNAAAASEASNLPLAEAAMPALAEEIRASLLDQAYAHKRSAFIDAELKKMPEAELVRFEFFIRSHFNRASIRRVMQSEVDKLQHQQRLVEQSNSGGGPTPNAVEPINVTDDMAIVVAGLSKLLVGELVAAAIEVHHNHQTVSNAAAAAAAAAEVAVAVAGAGGAMDTSVEGLEGGGSDSRSGTGTGTGGATASSRLSLSDVEGAAQLLVSEGKLGNSMLKGGDFLFSRLGALMPSSGGGGLGLGVEGWVDGGEEDGEGGGIGDMGLWLGLLRGGGAAESEEEEEDEDDDDDYDEEEEEETRGAEQGGEEGAGAGAGAGAGKGRGRGGPALALPRGSGTASGSLVGQGARDRKAQTVTGSGSGTEGHGQQAGDVDELAVLSRSCAQTLEGQA